MSGQLCVEPELDPEVLELDDGVDVDELDVEELEVDELDVELVPEFPVEPVVEVVAALATSAPPATRPEVSAPMASTLRRRNGMAQFLSLSAADPLRPAPQSVRLASVRPPTAT